MKNSLKLVASALALALLLLFTMSPSPAYAQQECSQNGFNIHQNTGCYIPQGNGQISVELKCNDDGNGGRSIAWTGSPDCVSKGNGYSCQEHPYPYSVYFVCDASSKQQDVNPGLKFPGSGSIQIIWRPYQPRSFRQRYRW